MICERKDRFVDRTSVYRSRLQPWQDPHAVPTAARLFELDLALTNHKCMFFDESRWTQARSPDRQRFRMFCPTEFFYRANATFGLSRNTDKSAEIDKRGVVRPSVGFWKERRSILPKRFSASDGIDGVSKIEEPRQNASSVSFDDWDWLIEGEAGESAGGVSAGVLEVAAFARPVAGGVAVSV